MASDLGGRSAMGHRLVGAVPLEVLIPVAVAILLTALMFPVARMLRKWGLPKALATAITVLGAVASIVGVLIVIGGQIAGQGPELSTNVVSGFNKLSDWLSNGPLTNWLRNGPLHINATWLDSSTWVTKVTDFLKASGSTIATYAAEFGAGVVHFFACLALAVFSLFYFIYDGRGIFSFLLNFIPRASRDRVDQAALRGWRSSRVCPGDNSGGADRQPWRAHRRAHPRRTGCPSTGRTGLSRCLRPHRRCACLGLSCRPGRTGGSWLAPSVDHAWRRDLGDAIGDVLGPSCWDAP